jgi:hypothetical protein
MTITTDRTVLISLAALDPVRAAGKEKHRWGRIFIDENQ